MIRLKFVNMPKIPKLFQIHTKTVLFNVLATERFSFDIYRKSGLTLQSSIILPFSFIPLQSERDMKNTKIINLVC